MTRILFIMSFFLLGCSSSKLYWDTEKDKVEKCREKWVYKDLEFKESLKVLLYDQKSNYGVNSSPNFIIGITELKDTIAIVDKDFSGDIKVNKLIKVSPLKWSDDEKNLKKPLLKVYSSSKENDLYCNVINIYYCQIDEIVREAK